MPQATLRLGHFLYLGSRTYSRSSRERVIPKHGAGDMVVDMVIESSRRFRTAAVFAFLLLAGLDGILFGTEVSADRLPSPAAHTVDFEKEVRPVLEKSCISCHGPEKQKGGYRLDLRDAALTGGDDHAPNIVPGHSDKSPLIAFVSGIDENMIMPNKGDRLTREEIGLLRAWIDQGAVWPESNAAPVVDRKDWWSFKPVAVPRIPDIEGVRNPIDAFIRLRLQQSGLTPSPEADRWTLIRRVTYDLTGLPPTPDEVERFANDPDPAAYEKLVDRLLASPRYGERWARHWLDAVHYGDTHGYDKDQPRPNAWPYRDYVIRSFNEDKPYRRFVQEQLAGDVLFPSTRDGIEALGFIAAGPWDLIGHAEVPESKRDGKIARHLDRDDMVKNTMQTFCSLTVQCAQCHNHKFDPITQEDYYSLQAVFAALDRADEPYDTDPAIAGERIRLLQRQHDLEITKAALEKAAIGKAGEAIAALDRKIEARQRLKNDKPAKAEAYGYHSAIAASPDTMKWVQIDLGAAVELSRIVLHPCSDAFNNIGDGFGFPVRFKVEACLEADFQKDVTVIADQTAQDFSNPKIAPVGYAIDRITARFVRITATRLALRKNDYNFALAEIEAFDSKGTNVAPAGHVTALDSIEAPPRWKKENLTDGWYPGAPAEGTETLVQMQAEREQLIKQVMTAEESRQFDETKQALDATQRAIAKLPPQSRVYAGTIYSGSGSFVGTGAQGGKPRPIYLLKRGNVDMPDLARGEIAPGAPAFLSASTARSAISPDQPEGERRAALAKWITDPANPLTWRSIVNRVWAWHFGRGLVDSPNDFGHMGQAPSDPALLDWLAAEFRDSGQSFKALQKLIVLSATYRQQSEPRGDEVALRKAQEVDADNRLLWRMNRTRLEAEEIRDTVLLVSGKLDERMYGPGFQDFVIRHPEHSPHYEYELADPEDPKSHRRSIYRFLVRSRTEPFMTTLDCADPSMQVDKRNESVSALHALALLNDKLIVTMSGHFAERLQARSTDLSSEVDAAYRAVTGHAAKPQDQAALLAFAREHGLSNLCRLLFNLNEFVFLD